MWISLLTQLLACHDPEWVTSCLWSLWKCGYICPSYLKRYFPYSVRWLYGKVLWKIQNDSYIISLGREIFAFAHTQVCDTWKDFFYQRSEQDLFLAVAPTAGHDMFLLPSDLQGQGCACHPGLRGGSESNGGQLGLWDLFPPRLPHSLSMFSGWTLQNHFLLITEMPEHQQFHSCGPT